MMNINSSFNNDGTQDPKKDLILSNSNENEYDYIIKLIYENLYNICFSINFVLKKIYLDKFVYKYLPYIEIFLKMNKEKCCCRLKKFFEKDKIKLYKIYHKFKNFLTLNFSNSFTYMIKINIY
uniref:Uncharacterized 15.0 kDa protein in rpl12-rps7 intergenic region n=1 Tax=Euglena longa TaxID=3037 RepID=YCX9_EUGLO|nr:hypothetical protein AsloCp34 [Euglena longa]P58148.1 RecName: Full=Uncharacterized 15.0 kDa protein in rpl12-rps7 intergenic region; AltName: Full=ORF122 [Euglena longa]CAC24605.1 hypothetical protein [Euglena longa]